MSDLERNKATVKLRRLISSEEWHEDTITSVRELLAAGANPSHRDEPGPTFGWSLLHWSAWRQRPAAIQALLEFGANVNVTNRQLQTPLHLAAISLDPATSIALIEAGALITLKDRFNRCPCDYAKNQVVKKLLTPVPAQNSIPGR